MRRPPLTLRSTLHAAVAFACVAATTASCGSCGSSSGASATADGGGEDATYPDALSGEDAAQPDGATPDATTPTDASAPEASSDGGTVADAAVETGPADAGSDAPTCPAGQQLCDGGCTPVESNNGACGSCTVACSGGQTCLAATCATPFAGEAGTSCDPNVRAAFSVVVTPDGVYLIEGIPVNQPSPLSTTMRIALAADGGLDPSTCSSTTAGSVPIAEYGMGLAQASGNVYLVSGATSTSTQPLVYGATIGDGGLTPFGAATVEGDGGAVMLQVSRYDAAMLQVGNFVYVIGGWSSPVSFASGGQDLAEVERAQVDPTTGAFITNFSPAIDPATSQPATLALPRFGGMLFHQGSWVYLLGGQTGIGANSVLHDEIQRASLDAVGNLSSFTQVGTLPTNLAGATAYVAGGSLYLLAGATGYSNPNYVTTNDVLQASIAADGSLGPFTTTPLTLAYGVLGQGSLVLGPTVYLLEGLTGFSGTTGAFETFSVP